MDSILFSSVPSNPLTWYSFGYGGTNAHTILDDAGHYLESRGMTGHHNTIMDHHFRHDSRADMSNGHVVSNGNGMPNGNSMTYGNNITNGDSISNGNGVSPHVDLPRLFVWSSNEQSGLARSSKVMLEYLSGHKLKPGEEDTFLEQLAVTLGDKRSRLPWKTFAVASTVDELNSLLEKPINKPLRSSQAPALAFIFTGQGAQWHAMGLELLAYSTFQQSLNEAAVYFKGLGCTWDLITELSQGAKETRINEPSRSQPICTAIQIALVDLLLDFGVKPAAVIGHSSGEIAAAYAKGAITRADGWKVAYHRGRVSSCVSSDGAMLAVGLGETAVQPYLDGLSDGLVTVACINSPSSVTLSGDASGIDQVISILEADKVFARKLLVKNAYHSAHMKEVAQDYLYSMRGLSTPASGNDVLMFSSVTGAVISGTALDSNYWISNMLNTVKFSHAVQAAMSYSVGKRRTIRNSTSYVFLEVGPHSALQGPLKQILDAQEGKKAQMPYISVLYRGVDAIRSSLDAIGKLILQGVAPNVSAANRIDESCHISALTDLPSFAWNRQLTYWYESAAGKAYRNRELPRFDLVGALSEYSTSQEPAWRNYLRVEEMPWMEHHKVQGSILYPLSGMIVMVIEASKQVADRTMEIEGFELRDIAVLQAMIVPVDDPVETKLQFRLAHQLEYLRIMELTCFQTLSHGHTSTNFSLDRIHDLLQNCPRSVDAALFRLGSGQI